jgi:hypothetical protein
MNKKLAFIYTYGRIGSTSLFRSISNKTDAHHFHNFKPYFDNHLNTTNNYTNIEQLLSSQKSIYIVTGVRDPIARTISALFTWITKEGRLNNLTQYSGGGKYFLGHNKEEIKRCFMSFFNLVYICYFCLFYIIGNGLQACAAPYEYKTIFWRRQH